MIRQLRDNEIEMLTSDFKKEVGVGIDELILDIDALIKLTEYKYGEDHFGSAFSGASYYIGSEEYIIVFNRDQNWSEKFRRFTLGHELGHLTIPSHRALLHELRYHLSTTEFTSDRVIEREADMFAINLLAPKSAFRKEMVPLGFTRDDIMSLSDTFQISAYAAAHRFVELTDDFACSLIACHQKGQVKYEIRSERMRGLVKGHRSLNGLPINPSTLASEIIWGVHDTDSVQLSLSNWYQDLEIEIEAQESIIDLGYNQLYLALIEPLSMDLPNEDDEELQGRLPSERWNDPYKY